MKVLVVGLGLIGGSICKSLKKNSTYTVVGLDNNKTVEQKAIADSSIDEAFSGSFEACDIIVICLYPDTAENFLEENAELIPKNCLITDVCGVKGTFSKNMKKISSEKGLEYIGVHPMAGREVGGYINSTSELFVNANFIIVPFEDSSAEKIDVLKTFAKQLKVGKIIVTSPDSHDKMIAYTSQLAHIVSSAYVKSPELELECGFSGGSFQDMTRIATMNESMWTDLFMKNRDNLKFELETLISNLKKYSEALEDNDSEKMKELIKDGRILKEENLKKRLGQPN